MRPAVIFLVTASVHTLLSNCLSTSYTLKDQALPADLDRYLAAQEAAVVGVIPGDEKSIAWAGEKGGQTPLSIVYIHGYQGSPHDIAPVLERVAREIGANLFCTRLTGYAVNTESIVDVTFDDWANDAWEAVRIGRAIGRQVVVVGTSMGGDLALWLAAQKVPGVAALVLLSPAVQPRDWRTDMLLWPWPICNIILRAIQGKYSINTYDAERYPTGDAKLFTRLNPARYRTESIVKLMTVVKVTRALPLESITIPSLWLYSEKDNAVDVPSIKSFFARTGGGGKCLREVPGSNGHMLAGDMWQPATTDVVVSDILAFLKDSGLTGLPASGSGAGN